MAGICHEQKQSVLRVVILGVESTGKTTLCEQLAKHFNTMWIPEYGRTYCEDKITQLKEKDVTTPDFDWQWDESEFEHIAIKQIEMEEQAEFECRRKGFKVLFCDTDALATSVWFWRYMGNKYSEKVRQIVTEKISRSSVDLYLLTNSSHPFVQDGLRDVRTLEIRQSMHSAFKEELNYFKQPFIELQGDWMESQLHAIQIVEQLLVRELEV